MCQSQPCSGPCIFSTMHNAQLHGAQSNTFKNLVYIYILLPWGTRSQCLGVSEPALQWGLPPLHNALHYITLHYTAAFYAVKNLFSFQGLLPWGTRSPCLGVSAPALQWAQPPLHNAPHYITLHSCILRSETPYLFPRLLTFEHAARALCQSQPCSGPCFFSTMHNAQLHGAQ
jgi:hypothetical protein